MSKLHFLERSRPKRLGRLVTVLSVFSLILMTAQLPAWLAYTVANAAAPSTALTLSSGGVKDGTGGRPGILPPSKDPGTDPAPTAVPIDPSATPDKGKVTDTPYPQDPSPTVPKETTPELPPSTSTSTSTPTAASPLAAVSAVDFSQCSNGQPPSTSTACPDGWNNGILNPNNSHYKED